MSIRDFELLTKKGNIAFFQSCEVTQIFIHERGVNKPVNLYTLITFEEKPFHSRNESFLTKKNEIRIDADKSIGIIRYWLSIKDIIITYKKIKDENVWVLNEDFEIPLPELKHIPKQYVPSNESQNLNSVLKNNFFSGSYIIEFFDEKKESFSNLINRSNLKQFNKISDSIKKKVPINLSLVSDRVGNIIFQFPIKLLKVGINRNSTDDGYLINYKWHQNLKSLPNCYAKLSSKIDNVVLGNIISEYNKQSNQEYISGNLDQLNHLEIIQKDTGLILHSGHYSGGLNFSFASSIVDHEPRVFLIDGKKEIVRVSGTGLSNGITTTKYTTQIHNRLYTAEKNKLIENLAFKEYRNGQVEQALNDIRELIRKNDKNGVYLWDKYISVKEIFSTLYFSPTKNVELRVLGSSKGLKVESKKNLDAIINEQQIQFNNPEHNNRGLNIEYRIQRENFGWDFHDRFLIFPAGNNNSEKPKAYSLGASINRLGNTYHIIQEVSHPQYLIDAFNELWDSLNDPKCLVWKYPMK